MTAPLNRRTATHLILAASLVASLACADQGGGSSGASGTPSEDDKIFYSIGLMAGMGIAEFELTEAEFAWVARGVADAALGREALANPQDHMAEIQAVHSARLARKNAAEAAASSVRTGSEGDREVDAGGLPQAADAGSSAGRQDLLPG